MLESFFVIWDQLLGIQQRIAIWQCSITLANYYVLLLARHCIASIFSES